MALFKIEKGLATNLATKRPDSVEGYCYFTTDDGKFYIDIATGKAKTPADNGGKLKDATRMPINSYLSDWAARAYADENGKTIASFYGNKLTFSGQTLKLLAPDGTELTTITLPKIEFSPKTHSVLGAGTTFTTGTSGVTFTAHTVKDVVGPDATFTVTNPTISVTPAKTNVKATASGTAVALNTKAAVTGIGNPTTASFVTSYPGEKSKLITTTIKGVAGTTTVSKISSNKSVTATKISSFGTAAKLEVTYIAATESLVMNWTPNAIAAGSDVTATNTGYSDSIVATAAANATTVATGSLSAEGAGGQVMTGLGAVKTASAITQMGAVTTSSFATGVKSVTQPTIALAIGATAGTGVISLVSGIQSASATNGAVTFNDKNLVSTITKLGTATAGAQKITVGTNDRVTALTSASTLTKT